MRKLNFVKSDVHGSFVRLRKALRFFVGLALLAQMTCAPVPKHAEDAPTELAQDIIALGSLIDPQEAHRAAEIALRYPLQLRAQYGVTDSPIIHNIKVNAGQRPRGLCWHWADDLQARLAQEGFQTLELHRAIANGRTRLRLDHSTVILSAKGAPMETGLVLDPWRFGGALFWAPVVEDQKYAWEPRQELFAWKAARHAKGLRLPHEASTEALPQ